MNDQITCPHCGKPIPLTEALSKQMEETFRKQASLKLETALKEQERGYHEREIRIRQQAAEKARADVELSLKDRVNEAAELKKRNTELGNQFLELQKTIRSLKDEKDAARLEMQKTIAATEEKIRQETQRRTGEEFTLKLREKDKKLEDALHMAEEYKRKLEQGSQQLQGEVLELELEETLRRSFPTDVIKPVEKGVRGADLVQTVCDVSGRQAGTIVWELKRTKAWSDGWITKLKEDQRELKAEAAILISTVLPDTVKTFGRIDGVWVGTMDAMVGIGLAVRSGLMDLSFLKSSVVGKEGKKEILWNYLTGTGFKQRVEAIYEAYQAMHDDLEKEKKWFKHKWAKQETVARTVLDNMLGMHGDLQGIVGKALPELTAIGELESGNEKEDTLF